MRDRHDGVFGIEPVVVVAGQGEVAARHEQPAIAGAAQQDVFCLLGLDQQPGQLVALGLVRELLERAHVAAEGVGVDLRQHRVGGGFQHLARLRVMEVARDHAPGARLLEPRQVEDAAERRRFVRAGVGKRNRMRHQGLVRFLRGHELRVLGLAAVPEIGIDAVAFADAGNEVERVLTVLGQVVVGLRGGIELVIVVAEVLEDRVDHLQRGHLLADPQVLVERQLPDPGHQHRAVGRGVVVGEPGRGLRRADPAERGDDAVAVLGAFRALHVQRGALAEQFHRIDVVPRRDQVDGEAEQGGDPFHALEAVHQQVALRQRAGEVERAIGGAVGHAGAHHRRLKYRTSLHGRLLANGLRGGARLCNSR